MRTITRGLALAAALAALGACHNAREPQTSNDPIGGDPRPQQPINDPKPQKSVDPVANLIGEDEVYGPQKAKDPIGGDPKPQESNFADPKPQRPIQDVVAGRETQTSTLTDGDVLAVTKAITETEVTVADLAKTKAQSAEVKQLASTLANHHRDAKAKEQRLEQKVKVQAKSDSDLAKQVKEDAKAGLADLKKKSGKSFDMAFVDSQLASDKAILNKIDDSLMPAAENPEVKSHLTALRQTVETHITQTEGVKRRLEEKSAATSAKAKTGETKDSAKAKSDDTGNKVLHETDTSKGNRPEDMKKDPKKDTDR